MRVASHVLHSFKLSVRVQSTNEGTLPDAILLLPSQTDTTKDALRRG